MFLNQFPIGLLPQAGYISLHIHLRNTIGAKDDVLEPGRETIQIEILCRLDEMYMRTKLQGVYLLFLPIFRAKKTCSANQDLFYIDLLKT